MPERELIPMKTLRQSESLPRLLFENWRTKRGGLAEIQERQQARFSEMVAFARAKSPYYQELYQDAPDRVEDPKVLPVTDKKKLMAHFDDWCTDPEVSLETVREFIGNPKLVGEKYLGKYTTVTTSGTTGTPGIFLHDERAMSVTTSVAIRLLTEWLSPLDFAKIVKGQGKMAMVMATGAHFASATAAAKLAKSRGDRFLGLSAHRPLPELVDELNKFQPALLAPYASMAAMLATEQEQGRLHINPVLLTLSAEGLVPSEYERIEKAFHAKVGNSYACSEVPFLSYACDNGWMHVNSDWVKLEAVDADYNPTPLGEQSHTVLVSNLANRVQPILRYDLGDSVLMKPDACECGNPLPALHVRGRSADVLTFSTEKGEKVQIVPLSFGILVDRIPGIERTQIVQTTPTTLRVRLRYDPKVDQDAVWQKTNSIITDLLKERGLEHVAIERAQEPPEQSKGGKFREVIPLAK